MSVEDLPVRPRKGRRLWLTGVGIAFAVVALLALGFIAGAVFQSPAQRAANTAAPAPSVITSEVTRGDLARVVTANAQAAPAARIETMLTANSGAIVTATEAAVGNNLTAGAAALEANGRPVFVLPGAFPFYRDMQEGDSGPDVKQLQAGLAAAGFQVIIDGRFGAGTAAAVRALYRDAGYSAPTAAPASVASPSTSPTGTDAPTDGHAAAADTATSSTTAAPPATVTTMPRTEAVVVPDLPTTVAGVPAVGTVIGAESRLTTEGGGLLLTSSVQTAVAATLQPGTRVQFASGADATIDGTVAQIGSEQSEQGEVIITYATPGVPDTWRGTTVLATITIELSAPDALIVPTTAVVSDGTGAYVLKQVSAEEFTRVDVTEIAVLDGSSAIETTGSTAIAAGDRVRVE